MVEVTRLVQERDSRHYISRLGIVEAQHGFAIKLRTGEITETDFEGLRRRFLGDIAQGQFQSVRVTEAHYREAERLIVTYRRRRFRTLDALQLAIALDLHRRGMTDYLVCADTNLCETAQELFIVNPGMALLEIRQPFGLGDLRADILDDALAFSQIHPGKAADAVDAGGLEEPEGMIQAMTV